MNGERQWWMSRIIYILAVNCEWKHLENSKIGLENSWIFSLPREWEPCKISLVSHLWNNRPEQCYFVVHFQILPIFYLLSSWSLLGWINILLLWPKLEYLTLYGHASMSESWLLDYYRFGFLLMFCHGQKRDYLSRASQRQEARLKRIYTLNKMVFLNEIFCYTCCYLLMILSLRFVAIFLAAWYQTQQLYKYSVAFLLLGIVVLVNLTDSNSTVISPGHKVTIEC